MKILIEAIGSHGDVLPFIGLATELMRRGHDVRMYGNERFARMAGESKVLFNVTSGEEKVRAILEDSRATESRGGLRLVAAALMGQIEHTLEAMRKDATADSVLVASTFGFAARLLAEIQQLPLVAIHLAPSLYRSEFFAPRMSPLGHFESWPRWCKRALWRVIDRRLLDPTFCKPLNEIRARHDLPAVQRVLHSWIHESTVNVGAFPEWFGRRQPDWPKHLQLTGFPHSRHKSPPPLPPELEAFLSTGDAPVVFTAGTANTTSQSFYAESAKACAAMGCRGILVAQQREQVPPVLPDGVIHTGYAPFDALFPRAAAVVHHGGIGTLSEALAAGVPQLIQPMAYDQFDNASRACRLGVARELLPRRYRAATVATELALLMNDARTKVACSSRRASMKESDGLSAACELIEGARTATG